MEQFNFREALGELGQCSKIDPKFVPALVNSGLAHFYLQEFPQAEAFFKKAVALNPSQPNALFALGMIYRNQNQMDAALESFSKILAADAQDSPTLYQAGQIYLKQQKYQQAVDTLKKVIELSPYDIAAHYNLATALIRKGDQADGQKMMETFTRLREKGGISNTGTQYGEQGKYMLAIGEYADIKGLSSSVLYNTGATRKVRGRHRSCWHPLPAWGIVQPQIPANANVRTGAGRVDGIGRGLLGLRQRWPP